MLLFAHRSPAPSGYRFVTRVRGHGLPILNRVLRIRCTLHAADHTVAGIRTMTIPLGVAGAFDERVEVSLDAGDGDHPPKYFELVAALRPPVEEEFRLAGIMDHAQSVIVLPPIAFAGPRGA